MAPSFPSVERNEVAGSYLAAEQNKPDEIFTPKIRKQGQLYKWGVVVFTLLICAVLYTVSYHSSVTSVYKSKVKSYYFKVKLNTKQ